MAVYQCQNCQAALSYIQYVRSHYCENPVCQRAKVQAYLIDRKKKINIEVNSQCQRYLSDLPTKIIDITHSETKGSIAILPSNTNRISILSDKRKSQFIFHLSTLYQAIEQDSPLPSNNYSDVLDAPLPAKEAQLLGKACATCKGSCCGLGKEHAFQDYASLKYFLAQIDQQLDLEKLIEIYTSYFPDLSYQEGCVFQADSGCTLPTEMRSFTCNNFRCDSLRVYHQDIVNNTTQLTFAAAVDGSEIKNMSIFNDDIFLKVEDDNVNASIK